MNVWYSKNNGMGIPSKHGTLYLLLYVNGLTSSQHVKDVRHTDAYTRTRTHAHTQYIKCMSVESDRET
jgi:hypothetical protein